MSVCPDRREDIAEGTCGNNEEDRKLVLKFHLSD